MTKSEWNKTISWLIALYPAWKPDELISAAWYDEIGGKVDPQIFKNLVRIAAAKNPSAFPPGIFEIIEAGKSENALPPGEMIWESLWSGSCHPDKMKSLPISAQKALNAMGGYDRLSLVDFDQLKYLKRTFVEAYKHFIDLEKIITQQEQLHGPSRGMLPTKQLKGNHDE